MSDVTKYFYKGGLNCAETTLKCLIEDGGAVAAIGSKYGRTETGEDRKPSADAVRSFLKQFEEEFGTIYCKELQKAYVKEHKLKSPGMYRACTVFVEKAVEWAKEMIEEKQ